MSGNQCKPVLVIGGGGHGKSVISVLWTAGYAVDAVFDDDPQKWGKELMGVPVTGPISELANRASAPAIIAIGDNAARKKVAERLEHLEWVTLIYPGAYVNPSARLGPGTTVFPGAVIGAEAIVGAHVVISAQCTVGHDCVIGDYAHLAAAAQVAGGASLGEGTFLAVGSVVVPDVRIGEWTLVGAGAVVVRDLPARCKALGVPARPV